MCSLVDFVKLVVNMCLCLEPCRRTKSYLFDALFQGLLGGPDEMRGVCTFRLADPWVEIGTYHPPNANHCMTYLALVPSL